MEHTSFSDNDIDLPHLQPSSLQGTGRLRVIAATTLGNALEFFDFTVYAFFASLIGKIFFPLDGTYGPLLLAFATFGAGFIARPIGGVVIGSYADRRGRKAAMTLTITLMVIGTALVGLAPTYAQVGIAAPLILVAGRLVQGFSAGGEVSASTTFLMESATSGTRAYFVSWQMVSQGASALFGASIAMLLTHILPLPALESWGWRLPFLLGLLIGPVGWYIRRNLDETHCVSRNRVDMANVTGFDIRRIVLCIMLMISGTSSIYVVVFYLPTYLMKEIHFPAAAAYVPSVLAALMMIIIPPLGGKLSDRMGRRKPMLYVSGLIGLIVLFPAFWLALRTGSIVMIAVSAALIKAMAAFNAPAGYMLLLEGFPRAVRGRALGIVYNVGVTLFGGFSPFIVTWMIDVTRDPSAPVWYMSACSIVSYAALLAIDDTRGNAKINPSAAST